METLNHFIESKHQEAGEEEGKEITNRQEVEKYLRESPEGVEALNSFQEKEAKAKAAATAQISSALEKQLGMTASHPGVAPTDWLRPGGTKQSGFRVSSKEMLSKSDVLDRRELKRMKLDREDDLHAQRVNIQIHCMDHHCSAYCWVPVKVRVRYNPELHTEDNKNVVSREKNEDGDTTHAMLIMYQCRMGFGKQLMYPLERDRTGGAERRDVPENCMDANQFPKYFAERNHPRVLQEPIATLHWGANADIKVILTNSSAAIPDKVAFTRFFRDLLRGGYVGLERYNGSESINCYISSYCCKGNLSTVEWMEIVKDITEEYVEETKSGRSEDEKHRTVRSIVAKFMNQVAKARDLSKDEASYTLAGGKLVLNTMPINRCSVNTVPLKDIRSNDSAGEKSFTFGAIKQAYATRPQNLSSLNLFRFVAQYYGKATPDSPIVPHFMGYSDTPTWPPSEEYSRIVL